MMALRKFNRFLRQTSPFIPIDVMPGHSDPVSKAMPQRPFHKALVAQNDDQVICHTNPTSFEFAGVSILGSSGQNIDDLSKYHMSTKNIDIAEQSLRWRHIAPTAPDTLYCYPFNGGDPFILDHAPHVYFVGNQDGFETKYVEEAGKKCLIVMVPSFKQTGTVVLVNLRTYEAVSTSISM